MIDETKWDDVDMSDMSQTIEDMTGRIKELEYLLKCSEEALQAEQMRADHILQQLKEARAVLEKKA